MVKLVRTESPTWAHDDVYNYQRHPLLIASMCSCSGYLRNNNKQQEAIIAKTTIMLGEDQMGIRHLENEICLRERERMRRIYHSDSDWPHSSVFLVP